MDHIETYLASIRAVYPDFGIERAVIHNREGQFNHILLINEAYIFRFPRYRSGDASLITEVQLLNHLQGRLSLPVPDPVFSNLQPTPASQVFMGYRMLPGQPLSREKLAAIADETVTQRLAGQLAGFLNGLHHIPIAGLILDLPVHDGPAEWASLYAGIREHLYPLMRPDARARVSRHFETYLDDPRLHTYTACLRHGDFGPGNILYDPQAGTITGILDFGLAGLGDPAIDIAAASTCEEAFFQRFCTGYPEIETLLARARFYKGTYALQEALHGFKNDDRAAFESGMTEYV